MNKSITLDKCEHAFTLLIAEAESLQTCIQHSAPDMEEAAAHHVRLLRNMLRLCRMSKSEEKANSSLVMMRFSAPVTCSLCAASMAACVRGFAVGNAAGVRCAVADMFFNQSRQEHQCVLVPPPKARQAQIALVYDGQVMSRPLKWVASEILRRTCSALVARLEDDDIQTYLCNVARLSADSCQSAIDALYGMSMYTSKFITADDKKACKNLYELSYHEVMLVLMDNHNMEVVKATWKSLNLINAS